MTSPIAGGVDCDLHPAVPHLTSLLPYLNDYWRDQVTTRGMTDLVSQSYPTHSPITSRPPAFLIILATAAIEDQSCIGSSTTKRSMPLSTSRS